MVFLMSLRDLFIAWLRLFVSPFNDINVVWILVPVWISWFFTEFFQEKEGTHFGNAITNGAIPIWVGIDWSRYLTNELTSGAKITDLAIKYVLCGLIILYGGFVIYEGVKAKGFAHFGGRIRVITYLLVMFTPIVYGVESFSWLLLVGILIFFPLFYFLIELIAKIIPDSKALQVDMGNGDKDNTPPKQDFSLDSANPMTLTNPLNETSPTASLNASFLFSQSKPSSFQNPTFQVPAGQRGNLSNRTSQQVPTPAINVSNVSSTNPPLQPVVNPTFNELPDFERKNKNSLV